MFYTRSHRERWYARKIGDTTTLAIGVAATKNTLRLSTGLYRLYATVACHLRQSDSTDATTSDCYLPAGKEIFMMVDDERDTTVASAAWRGPGMQNTFVTQSTEQHFVSVIRAGVDNGTLYISKISDCATWPADE